MTIRAVVQHPDPVLRVGCAPVVDIDDTLRALAADMFDTMYAAQGRGLAAPQVGMTTRLFVTDTGWKSGTPVPRIWINPVITWASPGQQVYEEACLSITGTARRLARPSRIALTWLDENGMAQQDQFTGMDAVILQHETDHLNGILMIDHPAAIRAPVTAP